MIEKHGVQCDKCSNYEHIESLGFRDKIAKIKSLGWLIKKIGDKWEHYCPACAEDIKPVFKRNIWWDK